LKYRIKELREKKNITQQQLADRSGICRATISALESGTDHETKVGTLEQIANALGVPISKIFCA